MLTEHLPSFSPSCQLKERRSHKRLPCIKPVSSSSTEAFQYSYSLASTTAVHSGLKDNSPHRILFSWIRLSLAELISAIRTGLFDETPCDARGGIGANLVGNIRAPIPGCSCIWSSSRRVIERMPSFPSSCRDGARQMGRALGGSVTGLPLLNKLAG